MMCQEEETLEMNLLLKVFNNKLDVNEIIISVIKIELCCELNSYMYRKGQRESRTSRRDSSLFQKMFIPNRSFLCYHTMTLACNDNRLSLWYCQTGSPQEVWRWAFSRSVLGMTHNYHRATLLSKKCEWVEVKFVNNRKLVKYSWESCNAQKVCSV